jgi:hypothetical protein
MNPAGIPFLRSCRNDCTGCERERKVKETMKDKDDNSGESAGDEKNPPSGAGQKDPGDLTNADGHKSHRKKPRFFVTDENDLTWPVLFWSAAGTAEGEK